MQGSLENMLICPETKTPIFIDMEKGVARSRLTNVSYPMRDGIIDFIPDTADRVSKAYDSSAKFYDKYMTSSGLHWKLYSLIMFGFLDETPFLKKPLSAIPDSFDGVLLDVPAGTGYFTASTYRRLPTATIIAVDVSMEMLRKAQHQYAKHGVQNVVCIRADVAHLPIKSGCIGQCLSMAGFHAFPDKDKALHEIARVLKHRAIFSGTFYIKGKWIPTDLLVNLIFRRMGYFTPPFFTNKECRTKLGKHFEFIDAGNIRSGFYFTAKRNRREVA